MKARTVLALGVVAMALASCDRRAREPGVLELELFRQSGASEVRLNETLVLHFSDELDRTSVTRESVRIVDERGVAAEGELVVEQARLEFRPEFPLERDLSDGGLRPATRYRLEIGGYPRPDGLRARNGQPLARCYVLPFTTETPAIGRTVFEDPLREPPLLALAEDRLLPLDPIRIDSTGPLDPTTLRDGDFELWRVEPSLSGDEGGGGEPDGLSRTPLSARLVANHVGGARIELRPRAPRGPAYVRPLEPGEYYVWFDPSAAAVRDLGGRSVRAAWGASLHHLAEIEVARPGVGRLREEFDDAERASPASVDPADGTATWSGDGRVRVRYPAAAGSGGDGEQLLRGEREAALSSDVHAARLEVPVGAVCSLVGGGNVVLRSQRGLVVRGVLRRALEEGERARRDGEELRVWRARAENADEGWAVPALTFEAGAGSSPETLSEWLARVVDGAEGWTVLIAGGDLTVTGRIELDGPLVLVAGGRVRVSGRVEARSVHILGAGGGSIEPDALALPLLLDEPEENPLVTPLRVAVLSSPVRPPGGVEAWRPASSAGTAAAGSYRVRFLGEREGPGAKAIVFGPVDDVVQLAGCQAVRLLVELVVEPGPGAWDPPELDWVELAWNEPERGR